MNARVSATKVLLCSSGLPHVVESYGRFSDSDVAMTGYRRSLEGFARWLEEVGLVPLEDR
jgi:hypothetical protein